MPRYTERGGGNDRIYGTNDTDYIYAGGGNDTVFASGNPNGWGQWDYYNGETGYDSVDFSLIQGGGVTVFLDSPWASGHSRGQYWGPNGITGIIDNFEAVAGTHQNDYLYGNSDGNWLIGKGGNDYLYGGRGNDVMIGDSGNDTFVFNAYGENNHSRDYIKDYHAGDVVRITGYVNGVFQDGAHSYIHYSDGWQGNGGSHTIVVENTLASQIHIDSDLG